MKTMTSLVVGTLMLAGCATASGGRGICASAAVSDSGDAALFGSTISTLVANGGSLLGSVFWPVAVPAAALSAWGLAPPCAPSD